MASLGDDDVVVSGPGGFQQAATLLRVDPAGDGAPRTATYQIIAPGGPWGAEDVGRYHFSLAADAVTDTAGNPIAPGVALELAYGMRLFLPLTLSSGR